MLVDGLFIIPQIHVRRITGVRDVSITSDIKIAGNAHVPASVTSVSIGLLNLMVFLKVSDIL